MNSSSSCTINNIDIEDIITNLPCSAHLKDSKTGKYLFSNEANLHLYKFKHINQIVGSTIEDFDSFMQPCWGVDFINTVKQLEDVAITNSKKVVDTRTILTRDGKVMMHHMNKSPVYGKYTNNVIGIFTYSQDVTSTLTLFELYEYYKKYYPLKNQAILKFLKHIECHNYFTQLPTECDLKVLLAKVNSSSNKSVANLLNISPKTAEIYSSNLTKKIKNENLPQVTSALRSLRNY